MSRHTRGSGASRTRAVSAAIGTATHHRGVRSMMVDIRTSPPERRTPVMLEMSKDLRGSRMRYTTHSVAAASVARGERLKRG